MPIYAYLILFAGWVAWFLPFPLAGWNKTAPAKRDTRGRWGLLLQALAYGLVWSRVYWIGAPGSWRVCLSILMLGLAALLSWTSLRSLGRHLRFDAALSVDHELVCGGTYRFLRHPIYTSMFCLLLGTGCMVAEPLWLAIAVLIFLCGTEIRVEVEDGLLANRFGNEFRAYQGKVSAYIPFLR